MALNGENIELSLLELDDFGFFSQYCGLGGGDCALETGEYDDGEYDMGTYETVGGRVFVEYKGLGGLGVCCETADCQPTVGDRGEGELLPQYSDVRRLRGLGEDGRPLGPIK